MDKLTKHEEALDASKESHPVASLIKINKLIYVNFTRDVLCMLRSSSLGPINSMIVLQNGRTGGGPQHTNNHFSFYNVISSPPY